MADLNATIEDVAPPSENGTPPGPPPAPPPEEWRVSKEGKEYTTKGDGRAGVVYRQGDETIAQARARDQAGRDKRPKPKTKTPKMPEASRKADLKELEATLAEALKAPALICATFGDEWAAQHFTNAGPYLARNLILASEHNPWLRKKLEEAATGEDAAMMLISMVSVGGAVFMYVVPPIIWWFNLPAPPKAREMFGIPDRKSRIPEYDARQPPPEPAPVPEPPVFA